MQRVTIRMPEDQVDTADELVGDGEFPNRSEVIRTALREYLEKHDEDTIVLDGPTFVSGERAAQYGRGP